MGLYLLRHTELFDDLLISLEYLYSVPSLLFFSNIIEKCFLNMSDSVFNNAVE